MDDCVWGMVLNAPLPLFLLKAVDAGSGSRTSSWEGYFTGACFLHVSVTLDVRKPRVPLDPDVDLVRKDLRYCSGSAVN